MTHLIAKGKHEITKNKDLFPRAGTRFSLLACERFRYYRLHLCCSINILWRLLENPSRQAAPSAVFGKLLPLSTARRH